MNGFAWTGVSYEVSCRHSLFEVQVIDEEVKPHVGTNAVFSTIVSGEGLRSNRKLQFCCKITDSKDANDFVRSDIFEVKVQSGECTHCGLSIQLPFVVVVVVVSLDR